MLLFGRRRRSNNSKNLQNNINNSNSNNIIKADAERGKKWSCWCFKHLSNIRGRTMIKSFMVLAKESAFKMCLLL